MSEYNDTWPDMCQKIPVVKPPKIGEILGFGRRRKRQAEDDDFGGFDDFSFGDDDDFFSRGTKDSGARSPQFSQFSAEKKTFFFLDMRLLAALIPNSRMLCC